MPHSSAASEMPRFVLVVLLAAHVLHAADWPQFRGPGGSGVAEKSQIPAFFGPQSNVLWKTSIPRGHSSPVLWGDKLFLTALGNERLQTLCLDRRSGKLLWKQEVPPSKIEGGARNGHPAASTPCTDGTNLFVYYGAFGVLAYDFTGKELWRTPLPALITQHGASSSPVLAGAFVILQRDADMDSHLLALNRSDGKLAWRTDRPDVRRSFCTPLVLADLPMGGAPQLIVPGTLRVAAYDSTNGRELWTVRGLPNEMCSSPAFGDGLLFVAGWTPGAGVPVMPTFDSLLERGDANKDGKLAQSEASGGPARPHFAYIDANKDGFISRDEWDSMARIFSQSENSILAIRPGGTGEVTKTHVAWKQTRGLPYVPSPLVYKQRVFLIRNGGLFTCFNATNGAVLFQEERIGALGDYYASPVAASGRICVISQPGTATILAAADELKVLAHNALGEHVFATPAIAEDTLYIRTLSTLYAFKSPH